MSVSNLILSRSLTWNQMPRLKHCGEITIALGSNLLCDHFQMTLGLWYNKAYGLFMFQTQSDTSPCMTTNTFGISRGTQRGEMWLGDRTGEIEIRMVMSSSSITLGSCCLLLCSLKGLYTAVGVGVAPFTSLVCLWCMWDSVLQSGCSFNVSCGWYFYFWIPG